MSSNGKKSGLRLVIKCLILVTVFGAGSAVVRAQPTNARILPTDFSDQMGSVLSGGQFDDPASVEYWVFTVLPGQRLVLEVDRLDVDFDPLIWLFEGQIEDQSHFEGGASERIDALDDGFVIMQDDGTGPLGFYQTEDPRLILNLSATATTYTLAVASFISGAEVGGNYIFSDGGDGKYDYTIRAKAFFVEPPSVVGRYLFYNNSIFDGNELAPTSSDDLAIDHSKQAYMAGGGPATFQSCTNYYRGINGIMIDIENLPGTPGTGDFEFRVGNTNDPSTWGAPSSFAISSVSTRRGAGVENSDRITVIFADSAIRNQWLQVKVLPTEQTGLQSQDVHYWASIIGETDANTGGVLNVYTVSFADISVIRQTVGSQAQPNSLTDIDKNGVVSFSDISAMRSNIGVQVINLQLP